MVFMGSQIARYAVLASDRPELDGKAIKVPERGLDTFELKVSDSEGV
jgi:hypothetical protein